MGGLLCVEMLGNLTDVHPGQMLTFQGRKGGSCLRICSIKRVRANPACSVNAAVVVLIASPMLTV